MWPILLELGIQRNDLLDVAVQAVFDDIGDFDVLANIAGGFDMGPTVDVSRWKWQRMFDINATTGQVLKAAASTLAVVVAAA